MLNLCILVIYSTRKATTIRGSGSNFVLSNIGYSYSELPICNYGHLIYAGNILMSTK